MFIKTLTNYLTLVFTFGLFNNDNNIIHYTKVYRIRQLIRRNHFDIENDFVTLYT